MAGISRVGVDTAGGIITDGSSNVYVGGHLVALKGSTVANHGSGNHASATITGGSSKVFVNGKEVCRAGDSASCGHTATGLSTVDVG